MAAKKTKPDEEKGGKESQTQDLERIENHLNYNPWLRGIYNEAKSIASLDTCAVLGRGLTSEELADRADVIRNGDYEVKDEQKVQINHEATAVPEPYFAFLYLIGGFSCRSVRLYDMGSDYLNKCTGGKYGHSFVVPGVLGPCVREKVVINAHWGGFGAEQAYPLQIALGKCDHGEYIYDRRYDSYSLVGSGDITRFNNSCGDMLNHALYRARENIKENWTLSADSALFGKWSSTEKYNNLVYEFKPDGSYIIDNYVSPGSFITWSTEGDRVIKWENGQRKGSACYKIKGEGTQAKLTITDTDDGNVFYAGNYKKLKDTPDA